MEELRKKAKELNINSFGMKKEDLRKEIENVTGTTLGSEESIKPQRERPGRDDFTAAKKREEEIRKRMGTREFVPIDQELKLAIPEHLKKSGFTYRAVVNRPGRIQTFQDRGWELMTGIKDVTAGDNSNGLMHRFMEIPTAIYDEFQAVKKRRIDLKEEEIKRHDLGEKGLSQKEVASSSYIQLDRR